jgi:hypothetical protein
MYVIDHKFTSLDRRGRYRMVVGITTAAGRWFSSGTPVSSTNKTDITEILLKMALSTITPSPPGLLNHQLKTPSRYLV